MQQYEKGKVLKKSMKIRFRFSKSHMSEFCFCVAILA